MSAFDKAWSLVKGGFPEPRGPPDHPNDPESIPDWWLDMTPEEQDAFVESEKQTSEEQQMYDEALEASQQEPRGVPEKFSQLRRIPSEPQDTGRMVDTPLNIADLFSGAGGKESIEGRLARFNDQLPLDEAIPLDAFRANVRDDPTFDQPITDQALGSRGLIDRTRAAGVAPSGKAEKPDKADRD